VVPFGPIIVAASSENLLGEVQPEADDDEASSGSSGEVDAEGNADILPTDNAEGAGGAPQNSPEVINDGEEEAEEAEAGGVSMDPYTVWSPDSEDAGLAAARPGGSSRAPESSPGGQRRPLEPAAKAGLTGATSEPPTKRPCTQHGKPSGRAASVAQDTANSQQNIRSDILALKRKLAELKGAVGSQPRRGGISGIVAGLPAPAAPSGPAAGCGPVTPRATPVPGPAAAPGAIAALSAAAVSAGGRLAPPTAGLRPPREDQAPPPGKQHRDQKPAARGGGAASPGKPAKNPSGSSIERRKSRLSVSFSEDEQSSDGEWDDAAGDSAAACFQ